MPETAPPRRLPPEYTEIWGALHRADLQAASRQELALRLGVSTYTLQRILVDGNVPRFRRSQPTRVLHAWVRILSRLAWSLGSPPRRWIELVGIAWDETIEAVSLAAVSALRDRRSIRQPPEEGRGSGPRADAHGGGGGVFGSDGSLEIEVAGRPPLDRHIPSVGRPFLEELARRMLLQLDPEAVLRFRFDSEESHGAAEPGRHRDAVRLAFGILDHDTASMEGGRTLRLPIFRIPLAALTIARAERPAQPPTWDTIWNGVTARDGLFLVRRRSNAHRFLAGTCGIPADRILHVPEGRPESLAEELIRRSSARAERVLLVDDSLSVRMARLRLDRSEQAGLRSVLIRPSDKPSRRAPHYPLLLRGDGLSGNSLRLLREARDLGLLGRGSIPTARLFAEAFVWMIRDGLTPLEIRIAGADGGRSFREAFLSNSMELLTGLYADGRSLGRPGRRDLVPLVAPAVQARETIREYLSGSWGRILEEISPARDEDRASRFCRSCSASLLDAHNQGVSDRYCRFCSDETGHLRPREEVRTLLANWMVWWQGDLTKDEAAGRAELYMRALPAWRDN